MRELPTAYAAESFVPFVLVGGRFNGEDAPTGFSHGTKKISENNCG